MPKTLIDVEVFKAGSHTDMRSRENDYTVEDLEEIARVYNEQPAEEKHIAPAVVGHPTDNSPAYGWVESLKVVGEKLVATFYDMADSFIEALEEGRYKTVSISLYPKDKLLRHIGWLGGVPPAVKGLVPVEFSEEDNKSCMTYTMDFAAPVAAAGSTTTNNADPVTDPAPAADTAASSTRQERSTKYGITVIPNIGYDEKPARFADLTDDDFADPVNYRFPVVEDTVDTSMRNWGKEATQKQYTKADKATITARLLVGAVRYGYEIPSYWCYHENTNQIQIKTEYIDVPPAMLSKGQLVKFLTGAPLQAAPAAGASPANISKNSSTDSSTTTEASYMDPKLEEMRQEFIQWLTETFGADAGSQADAKWAELAAKHFPAAGADTGADAGAAAGGASASESFAEKQTKVLIARVQQLEKMNRNSDHASFCEKAVSNGQILPAQITIVTELLEALHDSKPLNFSEGDKTVQKSPYEAFKAYIGTNKQIDFSEQATEGRQYTRPREITEYDNVDEESAKLNERVLAYQEKSKASGTVLSYNVALDHVLKGSK